MLTLRARGADDADVEGSGAASTRIMLTVPSARAECNWRVQVDECKCRVQVPKSSDGTGASDECKWRVQEPSESAEAEAV